MIVLGIDPGSKKFGWALLSVRREVVGSAPRIRVSHLNRGWSLNEVGMAEALIEAADLVVVEKLQGGLFNRGNRSLAPARDIVGTAFFEGGVIKYAQSRGVSVETIAQCGWRSAIGVGQQPEGFADRAVARAIRAQIEDWPRRRSNVHERDAAGAALGRIRQLAATIPGWPDTSAYERRVRPAQFTAKAMSEAEWEEHGRRWLDYSEALLNSGKPRS